MVSFLCLKVGAAIGWGTSFLLHMASHPPSAVVDQLLHIMAVSGQLMKTARKANIEAAKPYEARLWNLHNFTSFFFFFFLRHEYDKFFISKSQILTSIAPLTQVP